MERETRTKLVIRLLPPSLSEEAFKEAIGEWLDAADWFSYWQGKPRHVGFTQRSEHPLCGVVLTCQNRDSTIEPLFPPFCISNPSDPICSARELGHSRAYINLKDAGDVARFRQAFGGHAFLNERGTQFRCSVEYAPYQRVPRPKPKRDPREGTIEKDEDYAAFLARVEEGPQQLPSAEVQLQQREAAAAAAAGVSASLKGLFYLFIFSRQTCSSVPPSRSTAPDGLVLLGLYCRRVAPGAPKGSPPPSWPTSTRRRSRPAPERAKGQQASREPTTRPSWPSALLSPFPPSAVVLLPVIQLFSYTARG